MNCEDRNKVRSSLLLSHRCLTIAAYQSLLTNRCLPIVFFLHCIAGVGVRNSMQARRAPEEGQAPSMSGNETETENNHLISAPSMPGNNRVQAPRQQEEREQEEKDASMEE